LRHGYSIILPRQIEGAQLVSIQVIVEPPESLVGLETSSLDCADAREIRSSATSPSGQNATDGFGETSAQLRLLTLNSSSAKYSDCDAKHIFGH
jgi:hypothetical protein